MLYELILTYIFTIMDLLFSIYWKKTLGVSLIENRISNWLLSKAWRAVCFGVIAPAAILLLIYFFAGLATQFLLTISLLLTGGILVHNLIFYCLSGD